MDYTIYAVTVLVPSTSVVDFKYIVHHLKLDACLDCNFHSKLTRLIVILIILIVIPIKSTR